MDLFTDEAVQKKLGKAVVSYMGYFGSRYVGNDIQMLCGNILDHPIIKSFTLFCIMFQATDSINLALFMTMVFIVLQYVMSVSSICNKYVDKTTAKNVNIHATAWAQDKDTTELGKPKAKTTPATQKSSNKIHIMQAPVQMTQTAAKLYTPEDANIV